ncbi:ABC exporter membrane fusion protein [[Limnothrix rosea] IAM M-220]|uniref:ABC exporter membrane fusion protein n=1 Tax=[Limnothrix rosea] IAM M-220 TaxID=454133 RepID=UPI00096665D3|nr:ABC exporter membrane fusion protein [[Limnothrix rosea] IAM M-220]OKH11744.1 HlyD family secretion protein [[Limnothrix rosea] IAM M-220]
MQSFLPRSNNLNFKTSWLTIGAIAVGSAVTIGGFFYWRSNSVSESASETSVVVEEIRTVTALGRLEPMGEVVNLSAPTSNQGNRIEELRVQEGDRLVAGQVVAILDTYDQRQAALLEAEQQIKVAEAQLARVKAGAKDGEVLAQKAEINRIEAQYQGDIAAQSSAVRRLEAEVINAEAEYQRYQSLFEAGAISESQRDSKQLIWQTTQDSLREAQANLDRTRNTNPANLERAQATLSQIAEVRPVDIQVAQADVDRAIAIRDQAAAALEQAVVYAPIAGEVLAIHARPGEVVGTDGILDLAQNTQMRAIAEVYQSDIQKVKLGQPVTVISRAIAEPLRGTVTRIGSEVLRQSVVNTDPSVNIDARVVEVYIDLNTNSSQRAAKFTNLQVQAVIEQ